MCKKKKNREDYFSDFETAWSFTKKYIPQKIYKAQLKFTTAKNHLFISTFNFKQR